MSEKPVLENLSASTIDEVIGSLNRVVEWSKIHESRLGYFAALYRKVTIAVKEGIAEGMFDDGARMERLDVIFANRYLRAVEQLQAQAAPRSSWALAFETTNRWRPVVLQHLLVGMNAHINLDLAIAAARTAGSEGMAALKPDFYRINEILISLVNECQDELAEVWPLMRALDWVAGQRDERLVKLGMEIGRGQAWKQALELSQLAETAQGQLIDDMDARVTRLGRRILAPGLLTSSALLAIRAGERLSIPQIIQVLE